MKKILILTSNGFENPKIGDEFLNVTGKSASEIRVLFIPVASRTKEELYYVEESRKELLDLGIKKENIINYNLDAKINEEELKSFHVIYVCGGNTFYLLCKIRESGFDRKIIDLVNNGIVYVGASAGSILIGPDIEIAGIGEEGDKNDVKLEHFSGLNLTDKIVLPHYTIKEEEAIKNFEKENGRKIIRLKNNQALFIIGDKEFIV